MRARQIQRTFRAYIKSKETKEEQEIARLKKEQNGDSDEESCLGSFTGVAPVDNTGLVGSFLRPIRGINEKLKRIRAKFGENAEDVRNNKKSMKPNDVFLLRFLIFLLYFFSFLLFLDRWFDRTKEI
jgi:hypothetical protein